MRYAAMLAMLTISLGTPGLAGAASSAITLVVPSTQMLEGTTSHTFPPGTQPGRLVVKSNTPWALRVDAAGAVAVLGASRWVPLSSKAVLRTGRRGVFEVAYEIRAPGAAVVRIFLIPSP